MSPRFRFSPILIGGLGSLGRANERLTGGSQLRRRGSALVSSAYPIIDLASLRREFQERSWAVSSDRGHWRAFSVAHSVVRLSGLPELLDAEDWLMNAKNAIA